MEVLNRCLEIITGWMRVNTPNSPDKSVMLLVNNKPSWELRSQPVLVEGVVLPLKEQVHSLVVLLGPDLHLEAKMSSVALFISFG